MSLPLALFVLASLIPALVLGFLIVSVLWPKDSATSSDLTLKCCLSVGFGFGASSCLVFAWMLVVGQLNRGMLVCELMLLVGLGASLVWRTRASVATVTGQPEDRSIPSFKSPYLLRLVACVAALLTAVRFWSLSRQDPHGQFDAFATWNLCARFLYGGGQYWRNFTYRTNANSDYPLLLPASIAGSWEFVGRETQLIPIAIALLFTFATIGIVVVFISRFRSERQGLLAGLILMGTPFLVGHGASQYADVPLGFFFVAAIALLFFHAESPSQMHFLILAGMAAAFSAWTKNEGILFLVLLFFLHAVVTTLVEGRKSWIRQALALLTGAVPVSAVIFIYKLRIAAANGIIGAQGRESTIHNLLDVSRYRLILRHFEKELYTFGGWTPIFGRVLPLLLFFYFLLLGASVKKKDVTATAIAVLLPVFMMLGHFFVYILSPYDLAWHLDASLNRLFLQLWPVAIFAYFAILRAPEQAVIIYMESPQTHQSSASGVFGREIVIDPAPHHWWETHLIRRRSG